MLAGKQTSAGPLLAALRTTLPIHHCESSTRGVLGCAYSSVAVLIGITFPGWSKEVVVVSALSKKKCTKDGQSHMDAYKTAFIWRGRQDIVQ